LSAQQFSSRRFWDNMELLSQEKIEAISQALSRRLIDAFHVDLSSLVFDCTNFDTFLDTENSSQLAQRGHAKSKRSDLRIVGLALLVSVDFHVPLLWKVYPGQQHDSQTFAQVLNELTTRYQALARDCQSITLIFDKGNNSAGNQEILDASGFHFVGSLVPTHYLDLLAIPLKKFTALQDPRLQPTGVYRLTRKVWGRERTLLITFSPELQRKQRQRRAAQNGNLPECASPDESAQRHARSDQYLSRYRQGWLPRTPFHPDNPDRNGRHAASALSPV